MRTQISCFTGPMAHPGATSAIRLKNSSFARAYKKRSPSAPDAAFPPAYLRQLAIAGVSLRRIQELLGHKSITTTERYSHLGQNGSDPYFELAACVVNGFVPRVVTSQASEAV